SGIADAIGVSIAVEAVERAFRPRTLYARQPSDGAVPIVCKMADQTGVTAREQPLIVSRVTGIDPCKQAGMRQPGCAAEGGGDQAGGDHVAATRGDGSGELRARGCQRFCDLRLVERDGAVGLCKN
ncbi:hypothetical protein RZS08_33615, partial [Arthrospira platensis SPKY1]|nr:hypothetical protein [Arthrospira platensis SPKY1]